MPAFLQVTDTHAPVYVRKCDSSEQGTFFHCSVVQFWHSCAHCWSFFTQGHFHMQVGKQTFKHPISRWAPLPHSHSFSEQWGEPAVNSGNLAAARVLPPQCIYLIGIIYMNVWIKSKESSESFQTSGVCMVRMANRVYQKSNHKRGCYAFDLSWILSDKCCTGSIILFLCSCRAVAGFLVPLRDLTRKCIPRQKIRHFTVIEVGKCSGWPC